MRYAEVLLSYLEAVNESQPNAVDQNLLDLTINDIRDRVKLVGIKTVSYTHLDLPIVFMKSHGRLVLVSAVGIMIPDWRRTAGIRCV